MNQVDELSMCLFLDIILMQLSEIRASLLGKIEESMGRMTEILIERFVNQNSTIVTNHSEVRCYIYDLTEKKPLAKDKVAINRLIRENIQGFIKNYIEPKFTPLGKITKDPHKFVTTLNEVWSEYQTFIYAYTHSGFKLHDFWGSFYRMNNSKDHEYRTKYSTANEETTSVPSIGVNELKKFFQKIKLIDKFQGVFNVFLQYEREGKNVPRSQIRETIHSLESCYFDMDTDCKHEMGKAIIFKSVQKMDKLSIHRRSKDAEFFKEKLLADTLAGLATFYGNFVTGQSVSMTSTEEVRTIIRILEEEEARALYYIHSESNREQYRQKLNHVLIEEQIETRLQKEDGFKRYLELFDSKKDEFKREIMDLWMIFSRVPDKSIKIIRRLFAEYLQNEAEKVAEKVKKPPEFVDELIRLNSKCVQVVEYCGNNFELEDERINKIRGMLSNDLTERGRKEAKFDMGAKNLASTINHKFKISYSKGGQESLGEFYDQIVDLFKIIQEKTRFISEASKLLANRLLEDIEFSKDLEVGHIITLEKNFIGQIQKECGVSEVKELMEKIKDIEKSIDINNKVKNKLTGSTLYPLNQIIIKNANYWPERSFYNIENPPRILIKSYNALTTYFKQQNSNISFEFNTGISTFQGEFKNGKKQRFHFKNLHLLILLFVDEERLILFGNLKKKIQSAGINKERGIIDLARAVLQLLFSGLLISSTKSIKAGTPNICKITETDEFEINTTYDFVTEEKRKRGGKGPPPKPMAIIKGNVLTLSEELKRGFDSQIKILNEDEKGIQAERKYIIECSIVKGLKHAHHHQMNCTFEQLFKLTQQGRNKEFRVNEKFLKEIIEELINKEFCERVDGQRNIFRYIA